MSDQNGLLMLSLKRNGGEITWSFVAGALMLFRISVDAHEQDAIWKCVVNEVDKRPIAHDFGSSERSGHAQGDHGRSSSSFGTLK